MPEGTTPGRPVGQLTWIHQDPRGLSVAFGAGLARARAQRWTRDEASLADLRALLVYSLAATAALSPNPPRQVAFTSGQTAFGVSVGTKANRNDNAAIQFWLGLGAIALTGGTWADLEAAKTFAARVKVETESGSPPEGPTEEAGFPLVLGAIAIVTVTTAIAGVIAVYFSQRNEIDAAKVAADERVAKHASNLATMAELVDQHMDREAAAQQTIPWTGHELEVLADLQASTRELAKVPEPVLKSVPNIAAVTEGVGAGVQAAGEGIGQGVASAGKAAGFGAGAVVAILAALFLLSEERKRRQAAA